MKIGILTFHRPINYGAFLQAFALKKYLTDIGHDVFIVDYWPNEHNEAYKIFSIKKLTRLSFVRKVKYLLNILCICRRATLRKHKMETLMYNYFNIAKKIKYSVFNELKDLQCDCLIYGSDQIWWKGRLHGFENFDWVYWGDYVDKSIKKIAYAPSMGIINLTEGDKENIGNHLKNFCAISVREQGLKDAIGNLTKQNVQVVCDPVFLLGQKDWEKYLKPVKIPKHYLLLFNLFRTNETKSLAKQKAKQLNLPIVEITGAVNPYKFQCLQTLDAFEFIFLIKNADFVVTSSFHGTAFSVIFEKQFFATGMRNNSDRVASLLKIIGIEERLISDTTQLNDKLIDYAKVNPLLVDYIKKSKSFLTNSLTKKNLSYEEYF